MPESVLEFSAVESADCRTVFTERSKGDSRLLFAPLVPPVLLVGVVRLVDVRVGAMAGPDGALLRLGDCDGGLAFG